MTPTDRAARGAWLPRPLPVLLVAALGLAGPWFGAPQALAEGASPVEAMPASAAMAGLDDMAMLRSFTGRWKGRGKVLPNIAQERPFNVRCDFDLSNEATSVTIDGECGAIKV